MHELTRKAIILGISLVIALWQFNVIHADSISNQVNSVASMSAVSSCPSSFMIRIPQDCSDIQDAIGKVGNGGVIELATGTYASPYGGFHLNNLQKSLTIRAASGSNVVLTGQNSHEIVQYMNTDISLGGLVTFQGLTFANGYSAQDGLAGALTMMKAEASFKDCIFQGNIANSPNTGGGAVMVAIGSVATFENTTWNNNTDKNEGGALEIADDSQVTIYGSHFTNNRVNLPNHRNTAAGGAIHLVNSSLNIYGSHFQNNQAGYDGGAIYAIGTWRDPVATPHSYVIIANSFFTANVSLRDPSVSLPVPTEGGALLFEDQVRASIQNSRFFANSANVGGAISQYRSTADIGKSIFIGNRANGTGAANGFGGAISATSNDTGLDGNTNRPSASLTIADSLVWGAGVAGQTAGGIYVAGDGNRTYGINGASRMDNAATNRANVSIYNVVFYDTDVQGILGVPGSGNGGGVVLDLANLTMWHSMFLRGNALGPNGSGGGISMLNQSLANIQDTTFAMNTANSFGGAVFAQGSYLYMNNSRLVENEVSPGVAELAVNSYGAAIFTGTDEGRSLAATGTVENSIISNNVGVPIFDDDRTNGPINDMHYQNNIMYLQAPTTVAYSDNIANYCCMQLNQLNSVTVLRANGINTKKAMSANSMPSTPPVVGALQTQLPSVVGMTNLPSIYLAYAWSGVNTATIDGVTFTDKVGLAPVYRAGTHTMVVGNTNYSVVIQALTRQLFLPLAVNR